MSTSNAIAQRVQLAVSAVVFALRPHPATGRLAIWLPLVRRIREPYLGRWALPGGSLKADEDLVTAAQRTLAQTTGLAPRYLLSRDFLKSILSVMGWCANCAQAKQHRALSN